MAKIYNKYKTNFEGVFMKQVERDLLIHVIVHSKEPWSDVECWGKAPNEIFQLDGTQEKAVKSLAEAGYIKCKDAHRFKITPEGFIALCVGTPPGKSNNDDYRARARVWRIIACQKGWIRAKDWPEGVKMIELFFTDAQLEKMRAQAKKGKKTGAKKPAPKKEKKLEPKKASEKKPAGKNDVAKKKPTKPVEKAAPEPKKEKPAETKKKASTPKKEVEPETEVDGTELDIDDVIVVE